jgi:hypothetical protein
MKEHNEHIPEDPLDSILRQELKSRFSSQRSPANGRARLLFLAASPRSVQENALSRLYADPVVEMDPNLLSRNVDPFNITWKWVLSFSTVPIRHLA